MCRFVDHLAAESEVGRKFTLDVEAYVEGKTEGAAALYEQLLQWQALATEIYSLSLGNEAMRKDGIPKVAKAAGSVARIGLTALATLQAGKKLSPMQRWWLKWRLHAYAYEIFFIDKDLIPRILRDLRKPDALNKHNVAIFPGVAHLLARACGEEV